MFKYVSLLTIFLIISLPYMVLAQTQQVQISDLIIEAIKNPRTLMAMVIQFAMGLGLGYFSAKVVKYLIALILIFVLGSILSIWSIGTSPETFLGQLYTVFKQFQPQVMALLQLLGIMTVGPVTLGFIVGIIIAVVRK